MHNRHPHISTGNSLLLVHPWITLSLPTPTPWRQQSHLKKDTGEQIRNSEQTKCLWSNMNPTSLN
jgi:hypothetical protein